MISSDEGEMHWVNKDELSSVNLVEDFHELIQVMLDDELTEFQYVVQNNEWEIILK